MAYASKVEGSGIREAQTNQTARLLLHTTITAEVKSTVQESVKSAKVEVQFKSESPPTFTYDVSYTPTIRGHHELRVRVGGIEVNGSPTEVFVHHPPSQLGKSIRVIGDSAAITWLGPGITIGPQEHVSTARFLCSARVVRGSSPLVRWEGLHSFTVLLATWLLMMKDVCT